MSETIDDIVRELRKQGKHNKENVDLDWLTEEVGDLQLRIADLIGAAAKALEADCDNCRRQALDEDARVNATSKESLVVGNAAEMRDAANSELLNSIKSYQINSSKAREALEEIRAYVADMVCRSERNESLRKAIYNSARYALSAPPRNVDRFNTPDEVLSAYCEEKGITQPLPLWYGNEFWAFINWLFAEAKGDEK